MKKNLFYYLFAMICSVALFASCSDDDDEVTGLTIDQVVGTFTVLASTLVTKIEVPGID